MRQFDYIRATDVPHALSSLASAPDAKLLAGGTNLVDLMKYDVETPSLVVDINGLALHDIAETGRGGLALGALVTNSDVAFDQRVASRYPLLCSAILAGASGQLRNVATVGGNLLQRTRCAYFFDVATPCNKREPGTGCSAKAGLNRNHAILGASEHCIATHPSDMCVALSALDAVVVVEGADGRREIPIDRFHRLAGDRPQHDSTLAHGELVTHVELPPATGQAGHSYLKVRDRLSYAFALVAVAAMVHVEQGRIVFARVCVGSVAHKPWRDKGAEGGLVGQVASTEVFSTFADEFLAGAVAQSQNAYKIELARRAILRCLTQAANGTPQSQDDKRVV
jgi:xanthine dehydrogenase YagS FAD-binding subunit